MTSPTPLCQFIQVTHFPTTSSPQLHWTGSRQPLILLAAGPIGSDGSPSFASLSLSFHWTDFCIWCCALAQYQLLRGSSTFGLERVPVAPSRSLSHTSPCVCRRPVNMKRCWFKFTVGWWSWKLTSANDAASEDVDAWRLGLKRLRVQGFSVRTGGSTPHDGLRAVDTVCCLRGPAKSLITSSAWVRCERLDAQVRHQPSGGADTRRLSCAIIAVLR